MWEGKLVAGISVAKRRTKLPWNYICLPVKFRWKNIWGVPQNSNSRMWIRRILMYMMYYCNLDYHITLCTVTYSYASRYCVTISSLYSIFIVSICMSIWPLPQRQLPPPLPAPQKAWYIGSHLTLVSFTPEEDPRIVETCSVLHQPNKWVFLSCILSLSSVMSVHRHWYWTFTRTDIGLKRTQPSSY